MSSTQYPGRIRAPRFSTSAIIQEAEALGEEVIRVLNYPAALLSISFDAAYEQVIYPTYGIGLVDTEDLGVDAINGDKILGKYDPIENVAYIDRTLMHDPRREFTCWHEVGGHGILQGDWLRKELARLHRQCHVETTEANLDIATSDLLERQANLFAAHTGAPTLLLYYAIDDLLNLTRPIRYVGPTYYTLDFHGDCRRYMVESLNHLYWILAKQVQWRFGSLSIEALSYRIQSMRIIQDVTKSGFCINRTTKRLPSLAIPTGTAYATVPG